jgi:hypothetical protein
MGYVHTFDSFINENENRDIVKKTLDKFSQKVDTKKLSKLLMSHKDLILPYYKKYCKDGVINIDLIKSDIKKLDFSVKESDYSDDKKNNPVLRFLYKVFVKWPKELVESIWEFLKGSFEEGLIFGTLASLLTVMACIVTFVLMVAGYALVDQSINGLEKGVVKSKTFIPAHEENSQQSYYINGVLQFQEFNYDVPDVWEINVIGKDGREEAWHTMDSSAIKGVEVGQEISKGEKWTWTNKIIK